jgi:hypothetical protein
MENIHKIYNYICVGSNFDKDFFFRWLKFFINFRFCSNSEKVIIQDFNQFNAFLAYLYFDHLFIHGRGIN